MLVRKVEKLKDNKWTRLKADVSWGNKGPFEVFFSVPAEYSEYVEDKSADPFVMSLIQIAAKYNENIEVENADVSEQLTCNIEDKLIPVLAKMKCGNGSTKIIASSNFRPIEDNRIAATGISLGIDSFYSIVTNLPAKNKNLPISAVVYIHQVENWKQFDHMELKEKLRNQEEVAQCYGLKLIPLVTNIRHIMESELVFSQFHTFCHVGSVATIKRLIKSYYYSTGYSYSEMKLSFSDSANYENVIEDVFTFDDFSMISSGGNVTRFEKTQILSDDLVVQKYLDVCYHDKENNTSFPNCTNCAKCVRTMTTLDVCGKLHFFGDVFDLDLYEKNKAKCWGDVFYRKIIAKDPFAVEICTHAQNNKYNMPRTLWYYFLKKGIRNQIIKVKRKR